MALTEKQKKAREGKLTASQVACLMEGDEERIMQLWLELTGDPSFVPPDFSDNWHVRLGETTEDLNLDWFAKRHGPVTARRKVMMHPDEPWAACTLDGWSEQHACPIEAKHLIGFTPTPEAALKYWPQMHWQMWVTASEQCAFSAIQGGRPPEVIFVGLDQSYLDELIRRARDFWQSVVTLTPPVILPASAGKVEPVKEYDAKDLPNSGMFAGSASIWMDNRKRAKLFEDAAKVLKKLCPDDAIRVHGYGIEITRNKAGALSIKELEKKDGHEGEGQGQAARSPARRRGAGWRPPEF